ncbi:MAG TPA: PQQ-dependent sugar dehydrogenase, partial [Pseudomonadaceae bacterium]|nr:PQQ-dependent sugar dehydrogenase [Pseudomonadaceae bacterium]
SPSSLSFYAGEEFPEWQGDLFVGAMQKGQIAGTGQLLRLKLNADGDVVHQESLLTELRQRIRGVKQGPDGRLYLLTDEDDGLVLRIERADD